jgi:hypothetical protein
LFVGLEVRPSWLGRIAALVFRVPPVLVRTWYSDGAGDVYRLPIATAAAGLALGHLPQDPDGLERVLRRGADRPVTAIRVDTAGRWAYQGTLAITVFRLDPE